MHHGLVFNAVGVGGRHLHEAHDLAVLDRDGGRGHPVLLVCEVGRVEILRSLWASAVSQTQAHRLSLTDEQVGHLPCAVEMLLGQRLDRHVARRSARRSARFRLPGSVHGVGLHWC